MVLSKVMQSPVLGFARLGMVLRPNALLAERQGILNPAGTRLRNGELQLFPRMVAPGNLSRIGSFRVYECGTGAVRMEQHGFALEPEASYELRDKPGGYGCEDPRVTYIEALDRYLMAYAAFGPRGPRIALAISQDGLQWERLGLLSFPESEASFPNKDGAFFPEPVRSPKGVPSLAFYHRPTLAGPVREGMRIGYISLAEVQRNLRNLCMVAETHRLVLPQATWGRIKVGAGTPPVRVREGWLSVIHGVDELEHPSGGALLRYCAGIIVHDAERLDHVIFRSPEPLFVPEVPGEIHGTVAHVVFPTAIDRRSERVFEIYYGMADYEIGRARLTLRP